MVLFCPSFVSAEEVFFKIYEIQGTNLLTDRGTYALSETCKVTNNSGKVLTLSRIKLPADATGNYSKRGETILLNTLTISDSKNNIIVPE
jgi:hypothetical protein